MASVTQQPCDSNEVTPPRWPPSPRVQRKSSKRQMASCTLKHSCRDPQGGRPGPHQALGCGRNNCAAEGADVPCVPVLTATPSSRGPCPAQIQHAQPCRPPSLRLALSEALTGHRLLLYEAPLVPLRPHGRGLSGGFREETGVKREGRRDGTNGGMGAWRGQMGGCVASEWRNGEISMRLGGQVRVQLDGWRSRQVAPARKAGGR